MHCTHTHPNIPPNAEHSHTIYHIIPTYHATHTHTTRSHHTHATLNTHFSYTTFKTYTHTHTTCYMHTTPSPTHYTQMHTHAHLATWAFVISNSKDGLSPLPFSYELVFVTRKTTLVPSTRVLSKCSGKYKEKGCAVLLKSLDLWRAETLFSMPTDDHHNK